MIPQLLTFTEGRLRKTYKMCQQQELTFYNIQLHFQNFSHSGQKIGLNIYYVEQWKCLKVISSIRMKLFLKLQVQVYREETEGSYSCCLTPSLLAPTSCSADLLENSSPARSDKKKRRRRRVWGQRVRERGRVGRRRRKRNRKEKEKKKMKEVLEKSRRVRTHKTFYFPWGQSCYFNFISNMN